MFKVEFTETLRGSYIIEASSKEEAVANFEAMLNSGQIDTLDLEVVDTDIRADFIGRIDKNGIWVYELE